MSSANFAFLQPNEPELFRLVADAERFFAQDPDVSLVRLRQFSEAAAIRLGSMIGIRFASQETQNDRLARLQRAQAIEPAVAQLFHALRITGNDAAHLAVGGHRDALQALRQARELAIWFDRCFYPRNFRYGPFTPPTPVSAIHADEHLRLEIERLRTEADSQRNAAEKAALLAREAEAAREHAEARARREAEDHAAALDLAAEAEETRQKLLDELAAAQSQLTDFRLRQERLDRIRVAAQQVRITEADTRLLIDAQLRAAGWEADTLHLRYNKGVRPAANRNLAIAEWPTDSGPADYILFAGLQPVGVVEAKATTKEVQSALSQAARYSQAFADATPSWGKHRIPFLFSTNGRPYFRPLLSASGIWFHDIRLPHNHPRALEQWYTPDGLLQLLKQDISHAEQSLAQQQFPSFLRDYQVDAIRAVEAALQQGQRECLVSMATGTGKTKTAIALLYRLVKSNRFRRILFLVDRTSLLDQTVGALDATAIDEGKTFPAIYALKHPKTKPPITPKTPKASKTPVQAPSADTRLQIATVQSILRWIDSATPPTVDVYDLVLVDECHRGYTLDRDRDNDAPAFSNLDDYLSAYRRVLDHFDAIKIGLTATPALHTAQIFGPPVYTYGYRRAVLDGFLVDHEPPYQIHTRLSDDGIHFAGNGFVKVLEYTNDVPTEKSHYLPEDMDIEVEDFNRKVITRSFNEVVCNHLAEHIDPNQDAKTLIFCVNDAHANLVVELMKAAFDNAYGPTPDNAVQKITSYIEKPDQQIRNFQLEAYPRVAVTVDLLTTGVDVPRIVNLVFLRRVRSRILYEQMLGRATRLCPEIGKQYFRIFDAVRLYEDAALHSDMKPVAKSVSFTFQEYCQRLTDATPDTRDGLVEQIKLKLRRKLSRLSPADRTAFEDRIGSSTKDVLERLHGESGATWIFDHLEHLVRLDTIPTGTGPFTYVSDEVDAHRYTSRGYGQGKQPGDYLAEFDAYLRDNLNRIPALLTLAQRPHSLSRTELKSLLLQLDDAGFSDAGLRTAWRETTNADIAASIIGHIRRSALGDALIPHAQRVDRGLARILARQPWTIPQRNLLEMFAAQLKSEFVLGCDDLDRGIFQARGGFDRLNRIFGGDLQSVVSDLQDEVWKKSA